MDLDGANSNSLEKLVDVVTVLEQAPLGSFNVHLEDINPVEFRPFDDA